MDYDMNHMIDEDDELLFEIPAFLTKCESGELYVLQYPTLNNSSAQLDGAITSARIKQKCKKLELTQMVDQAPIYDSSKGEQLALNVDGAHRDKKDPKDNYFESDCMDRCIMKSQCPLSDVDRYAVAYNTPGVGISFSPVSCVMPLRPAPEYMDKIDARVKDEKKKDEDDDDDERKEDAGRAINVRFERVENDRMRNARENSYNFMQRQIEDESWVDVDYYGLGESHSEHIKNLTIKNIHDERIDQFHLTPSHFLSLLVPQSTNNITSTKMIVNIADNCCRDIPRSVMYSYPVEKQLEIIMRKVGVGNFREIIDCLEKGIELEELEIITKLQQSATLVQGCWVIKSILLYPSGKTDVVTVTSAKALAPAFVPQTSTASSGSRGKKAHKFRTPSGTPYTLMQDAREYALCMFAKDDGEDHECRLTLDEINKMVPLPGEDLLSMLAGVAKPILNNRGKRTGYWEFIDKKDTKFISKHREVAQRYSMKWKITRHKYIKLPR